MDQVLDENEQHVQNLDENTKLVGLYKVNFEINDQERTIDLLLTTKRSKRLNSDLENTFKDIQVVWMERKLILN
jgi:hypothetical protein